MILILLPLHLTVFNSFISVCGSFLTGERLTGAEKKLFVATEWR